MRIDCWALPQQPHWSRVSSSRGVVQRHSYKLALQLRCFALQRCLQGRPPVCQAFHASLAIAVLSSGAICNIIPQLPSLQVVACSCATCCAPSCICGMCLHQIPCHGYTVPVQRLPRVSPGIWLLHFCDRSLSLQKLLGWSAVEGRAVMAQSKTKPSAAVGAAARHAFAPVCQSDGAVNFTL